MHTDELRDAANACLGRLVTETLRMLENSRSSHLQAITDSTMESGTTRSDTLTGGLLRAPEKPPFKHEKAALMELHRALFESTQGALYSVIVHFRRENLESPWIAQTKLVSRAEHDQLVSQRQPIDIAVKEELGKYATQADWERVSFGRDTPKNAPNLVFRNALTGLERLEPSPRMFELLAQAESLYARSGLELRSAYWTLRPQDLSFFEYYE